MLLRSSVGTHLQDAPGSGFSYDASRDTFLPLQGGGQEGDGGVKTSQQKKAPSVTEEAVPTGKDAGQKRYLSASIAASANVLLEPRRPVASYLVKRLMPASIMVRVSPSSL